MRLLIAVALLSASIFGIISTATADTDATKISYKGSKVGLRAKNVAAALDALGIQLKKAISTPKLRSGRVSTRSGGTTWKGNVVELCQNQIVETEIILTFTPDSNPDTGSWSSTPGYVFSPKSSTCAPGNDFNSTWSGNYKIVGTNLFAYNISTTQTNPPIENPGANPGGTAAEINVEGNAMTLVPRLGLTNYVPTVFLEKQ